MLVDISQLSIAERIQLVEDIWDSIMAIPEAVPVTLAQQEELERRLAAYAADPVAGKSWEQVKHDLKRRSRI